MDARALACCFGSFTRSRFQVWLWPVSFPLWSRGASYLFVSILSQSNETQTLPIGSRQTFMTSLRVQWGLITAGTVVAIVPTVVFFSIVQRRLVSGLTAGAVK